MNTEISSKLSLYDILAMLIPGALIIFWASNVIFGNDLTIDESRINPWIVGVFFTATSYLVGIIYFRLMEYLSRYVGKFINNPKRMKKSFDKKVRAMNSKKVFENELFGELKRFKPSVDKKQDSCKIQDIYYEAYAFVAKNTYRNYVHILESQFAFLRSMFGVVFLFLCFLPNDNFKCLIEYLLPGDPMCWVLSSFLVLLIAIPFVMACIQKKIYEIVWEDYEYFHRVKDDK